VAPLFAMQFFQAHHFYIICFFHVLRMILMPLPLHGVYIMIVSLTNVEIW
jgi:hypothetical protein